MEKMIRGNIGTFAHDSSLRSSYEWLCKVHILENEERRLDGSVVNLKAGCRYKKFKNLLKTLGEGIMALKEEEEKSE